MAALGAPGVAPEGRFYPDTYAYSKGSERPRGAAARLPRDAAAAGRRLGTTRTRHAAAAAPTRR